jgi:predicted Zn-dependent protease with MMP-like domain
VATVVQVTPAEFEDLVAAALDLVPQALADLIENLVVLVEPEPPADGPVLFGLYEGIPLTSRGPSTYAGAMPDRVTIYRGPLLRYCRTREEVVEQVTITVVHEIAHHFGIDDDRLHELGYG